RAEGRRGGRWTGAQELARAGRHQGRLDQDIRLDEHYVIISERRLRRLQEVSRPEPLGGIMGLLLVVNLHGQINVRREVRSALRELRVERRFSATVVRDDQSSLGLLDLAWASW